MKKTTLYFIWLPQILFFLVCNACIWDQKRTHFDLSTISSQDLIKLAENIKPNPTVSLEAIGNIPYTVLSPDGKRMAKVHLHLGIGIFYGLIFLASLISPLAVAHPTAPKA